MAAGDFIDLLKKAEQDPEEFKKILADPAKHDFTLTSSELATLKSMDPAHLKTIASNMLKRELAGSQACQACADRTRAIR